MTRGWYLDRYTIYVFYVGICQQSILFTWHFHKKSILIIDVNHLKFIFSNPSSTLWKLVILQNLAYGWVQVYHLWYFSIRRKVLKYNLSYIWIDFPSICLSNLFDQLQPVKNCTTSCSRSSKVVKEGFL